VKKKPKTKPKIHFLLGESYIASIYLHLNKGMEGNKYKMYVTVLELNSLKRHLRILLLHMKIEPASRE
jgi:hypothetical protein